MWGTDAKNLCTSFIYLLAVPHTGMQDLSFPTWDGTCAPYGGSTQS